MNFKKIVVSPDIYQDSLQSLYELGFDIVFTCENTNVSKALRYHADMQLCRCDDIIITAPECFSYYKSNLQDVILYSGNTYLSCNYPSDIAYNIIVTDNYAVGNFKYTELRLKEALTNRKLINVSQGYTACTALALSDTAYITSDSGIFKTLKNHNMDVLLIDDYDILLPGYDHGFLGGSSFLSEDMLAVNGNIKLHKNYDDIKSFCRNYDIHLHSLSTKSIMDIGSMIIV